MSALREARDDYLRIRRRLGFAMPQDRRLLEGFVEFLDRAGAQRMELNTTFITLVRDPAGTEAVGLLGHPPVDVRPLT